MKKTAKKLKSVLKDAQKYAEELNISCQFDQTLTTMTYENTTTELQKPAPKLLTAFLANAVVNNLKKEVGNQNWLGALTLLQYSDNDISPDSTAIHYKWRNIPDIHCEFQHTATIATNKGIQESQITATKPRYNMQNV